MSNSAQSNEEPKKSRRGGRRPGAGRKRATPERGPEILPAIDRRPFRQRFPVFPLEHLMTILNDVNATRAERFDAAKEAAPYVHVRLAALKVNVDRQVNHSVDLTKLTDDELIVFERILAKAQVVEPNQEGGPHQPSMIEFDPTTGEARESQ